MTKRLIYFTSSSLTILIFIILFFPGTEQQKRQKTLSARELNKYLFEQKKANRGKAKFDKPDKATEEEIAIRSEVDKPFAYKNNWRFIAQKEAKKNNRLSLRKAVVLNWIERGPGNYGGRTRAVVVRPTTEDIWWVGAVGGGIW